jgi:hypothetical protein
MLHFTLQLSETFSLVTDVYISECFSLKLTRVILLFDGFFASKREKIAIKSNVFECRFSDNKKDEDTFILCFLHRLHIVNVVYKLLSE